MDKISPLGRHTIAIGEPEHAFYLYLVGRPAMARFADRAPEKLREPVDVASTPFAPFDYVGDIIYHISIKN
jgi:hypothetical protein